MKCYLDYDPIQDTYRVFVWSRGEFGDSKRLLVLNRVDPEGHATVTALPVLEGETVNRPTIILPKAWVDAIVDAVRPRDVNDAQRDHLEDARKVRDRLLSLIERSTE